MSTDADIVRSHYEEPIVDPETGTTITLREALSKSKGHPAYEAALIFIKAKLEEESPQAKVEEKSTPVSSGVSGMITVRASGMGGELCQDFVSTADIERFRESGTSWDDFCANSLGLQGYWDFAGVAHCTGLEMSACRVEITHEGEVVKAGDLFDLLGVFFAEEPQSVGDEFGKLVTSSEGHSLVTAMTSEHFEVEESFRVDDLREGSSQLEVLIACSDEWGFGSDFGDLLVGLRYGDKDYHFEYPGGVGVVHPPSIENAPGSNSPSWFL